MTTRRVLAMDLRFWPDADAHHWRAVLDAVVRWDPALAPHGYHIDLGDDEQPEPLPWGPDSADELARRCATTARFGWSMLTVPDHHWGCDGNRGEVSIDLGVPVRASAVDDYLSLVEALPAAGRPGMAMIFPTPGRDVTSGLQGLRRLTAVPPILHLDRRAIANIGGLDHVRRTPCELRDAPDGGLVLLTRPDPFRKPGKDDAARAAAVADHLGIGGEARPLSLAG